LVFEPRPDVESAAAEPAPPARPVDTEYAHPASRPPLDFRPPASSAEDEAPSPEPAETFRSRPIWPWVIAAAALVAVVAGAAYQHFRLQRTVPSRVSDLVSPGDATPKPPATESEPPGTDLEPPEAKPELTEPPKIELAPGAPGIDVGPRPTEGAPGEELLELEPESEPPEEVGDPDLPRSAVVRDPRTGLTWLSSDNARDVDWASAKAFCARNTAGSQGDWRLPTVSELRSIYDRESQNQMRTRLGIEISDFFVWSSQGSSGQAQYFTFMNGESGHLDQATSDRQRAICVSGG
ncbi:MAG: DUF1566 domain-containing protein, partial [bacterium]|nr:DUF1566 domain-containing protein [bacterium]